MICSNSIAGNSQQDKTHLTGFGYMHYVVHNFIRLHYYTVNLKKNFTAQVLRKPKSVGKIMPVTADV